MSVADRLSALSPEQRALFEKLREAQKKTAVAKRQPPPIRRAAGPRDAGFPLSYAQQRLWFLHQLDPESPAYNLAVAVRFGGPLDVVNLTSAVNAVVRRHEALRTRFVLRDSQPVQIIEPPRVSNLPRVDLSALAGEQELWRIVHAESARPFDLETGPLFRTALFRLGPEEHFLLATMHHVVADAWSGAVLVQEVGALYLHGPAVLPALPVQYADYAVWQREWLSGEVLQAELDWWRERLAGAPPRIELPTDRPRATAGWRAGKLQVAFSAELSRKLALLGQRAGATPFMVLMAAFQVLIGRSSGQDDVPVATVVANRMQPEIEKLIGFFVNTLVLRGRLGEEVSFRGHLKRTRDRMLEATHHQEVSFEQVVEAVRPERVPGEIPFFQALFVLQNAPQHEGGMPGLRLTSETVDSGEAKLDLALQLFEQPGGFAGDWEFRADLFDAVTMARMTEHLRNLLEAAVEDPDCGVLELPLLSPAERRQALVEWNEAGDAVANERPVHQVFAALAAEQPDAAALVFPGGAWSYGELDRRAGALAQQLRARGVGPERIVAICAERSPEMIVAALAVLKAGGAYLPFDPGYPAERLRLMWEDSGRPLILASQTRISALPEEARASVQPLKDSGEPVQSEPEPAVSGDNLAYVIYTSGSTGRPKGTMVSHRELRRRLEGLARVLGIGPASRVLQLFSFSFDMSVAEIFGALTQGAELHLISAEEALPGPALVEAMRERRITFSYATPQLLLASPVEELPDLAVLAVGGEAVTPEVVSLWGRGRRLVHGYGPTEATVAVTMGFDLQPDEKPPIGRTIDGTRVYLLDARFEPESAGIPGELWIAGAGLARGYWGRPGLTGDRFRPDPYAGLWGEPGARMYRTGDLARYRPDGQIDFLGRIDNQVKIRGFRIEPGEIETVLLSHPRVREAAVVAREDWGGEKRLVAYCTVVGDAGTGLPTELREHLAGRLPAYMVPAAFILLPELPLNANNKLDHARLPVPGEVTDEAVDAAPRTPTEELVAAIWAEVLDLPRVSRFGNFFDLGGHSLLATRVASRLREAAGVELPVREIFRSPTVASLAAAIEAALSAGASSAAAPPILPIPRDRELPLSFAQERLWFLDRLAPGNVGYHIPLVLAAQGNLSLPALEAALGEMVRRHEALRTTFEARDDQAVQIIAPPVRGALPLVDLSGLPRQREDEARRLADAAVARPFDLERDSVLRASTVRLAPDEHVLLLVVHHIAADGWSVGVIVEEIAALYPAALFGIASSLSELPVQYADFAVWQREWLQGDALERQLAYWRERLAGVPVLDLPTDRPRPAAQSFRGATRMREIGPETTRALEGLARRHDSTLFMVLLAAMQTLLGRYAGQEDVVVGSPIANRNRSEIEPLIGFFVNTLALRGDLTGDPSFSDLIARSRRSALEAYSHQDLPFERLVEELNPERRLSHNPLFQVMFAVQNAPLKDVELPGITFAPVEIELPATRFDLEVFFTPVEDGLSVQLTWSTDLFDPSTVLRLAGHLDKLLAAVLADPSRRLSELPLVPEAERQQLLRDWNDTAAAIPEADVAALFVEQARRRPQAVAVSSEEGDLSYAELDVRSSRLAQRLAAAGVAPETRIALLAQRSPAMLVGLLGILKAGGAYVPLDPAYPAERLAWMLADSEARVLLGQPELLADLPDGVQTSVTIELTADPEEIEAPEPLGALPDGLAYVMYTSGSTGRPKGVGVTHRNILRLVKESGFADLGADQVFLQLAPISFDASTLEIWAPLLNGGRVAVFPPRRPSLEDLGDAISRWGVTSLWLTAGLFHQMVDDRLDALRPLRQLLAGGDVLSPSHVRRALAGLPGTTLINGYGPTEGTTFTCCHPISDSVGPTVSIGRPIGNTRVHVLGPDLQPVPTGVWGELCAGGDGLARGYLGNPDLTAERFVPDPFGEPGARLYRTGDVARFGPSGLLEFQGRRDGQVKLRGFRVELGEIENALARHSAVCEAAVVARDIGDDGGPIGKRLVAYVVLRPEEIRAPDEGLHHVEQWRELYDQTYAQAAPAEATFNIQGWNSSYTGEPIPAEEMREWLEGTVDRLLALPHRRVMEVGCGTGLLLFRVAPEAERYRGTDFSAVALAQVRAELGRQGLAQVDLAQGLADDWTDVAPGDFDLVVLNSIVQYFPSVEYLVRVLEGAVAAVSPGGAVFVGDVRSLPLLEAFHTSVQLHRASDSLPVAELMRRIRRRVADEEELVVDPALFHALARKLPQVSGVEVLRKRGTHANELTKFRYDVVLRVGPHPPAPSPGPPSTPTPGEGERTLAADAVALELLAGAGREMETVAELRREIDRRLRENGATAPEDLWELADRLGCDADQPWSAYANDPLRADQSRRLVPELKHRLESELPEYMVPTAFVVLDALPLTPNGKVDRAALPAPERLGDAADAFVAPATPLEERLARVAAEVLGVEQVGMRDNFFDLGGHSLLATQLVSRLTREYGIQVTLQMVFDSATLADLADAIVEQELRSADAELLDEALREMEAMLEEGVR